MEVLIFFLPKGRLKVKMNRGIDEVNSETAADGNLLVSNSVNFGNFEEPAMDLTVRQRNDRDSAPLKDNLPNEVSISQSIKRNKKAVPQDWSRNTNKNLRMAGKMYKGYSIKDGRVEKVDRIPRKLGSQCTSQKCKSSRNRQCSNFSEEERKMIFDNFWLKMNWQERKVYICSYVTKRPTFRQTTGSDSRRLGTYEYYLNKNGDRMQVCRQMFTNTHSLGYKTVQDWVTKSSNCSEGTNNESPETSSSSRISLSATKTNIIKFLDSLAKLPSHYGRRDSMKLYLEPCFNSLTELYKFYAEECKKDCKPSAGRKLFSDVFYSKNLSIYQKKKDQCNKCASYNVQNLSASDYNEHLAKKDRAREEKENDKNLALEDKAIVLTMDLQAVKLCPQVKANAFYYKTKLACYNFTIYDLKTKNATCYWFFEHQCNKLVSSVFASCIIDYLRKKCLQRSLPIILYSDGCTYQNRNVVLSNALLNFCMINNISLQQKFLEPGHTQMECDSVHSLIERKLKNTEIYLPSQYIAKTIEARNPSYEAISLDYKFFKDYSLPNFLRYSTIRPGRKAHDPMVTHIRAILYQPAGEILYKLKFDDHWMQLTTRPKNIKPILDYPPLFKEKCKIKKSKWTHLQDLKAVIPNDCHTFYDSLPYED